ncbi:MAG: GNAT family N-acetyltransferase [Actinomycetota bacterium]
MPDSDADDLRSRYDSQLRLHLPERLPEGVTVERDGPLLRVAGSSYGGFLAYRDLDGLDGPGLDELIARQVDVFAHRGERFEWKLHEHDRPSDLADRLRGQGFVPEEVETVMIAPIADLATSPTLTQAGVTLREVSERADLERIGALEEAIWQDGQVGQLPDALEEELAVDPDAMAIVVAESGGEILCAGWVRFVAGTDFSTLWGGGTLTEWRGRGIYRSIVAYRADLAARRGFRFLQVDASAESRPILQRLGFVAVTTATPFVWTPLSAT